MDFLPLESTPQSTMMTYGLTYLRTEQNLEMLSHLKTYTCQSQDLPFLEKEVKGPELTLKSQCTHPQPPPPTTFQSS